MRQQLCLFTLMLLLLLNVSCATTSAPDVPAEPGTMTGANDLGETAPVLRLDARAVPRAYDLEMWIDPAEERFDGEVAIDLTVQEPSRVIWLNAVGVTIDSATLTTGDGRLTASVLEGNEEVDGLAFSEEIAPGPARLTVRYTAPLAEIETSGAFRQKDRDEWYVFTQFEAIYARRAIPSFDDPALKTPWSVTIHAPETVRAYANTPLVHSTPSDRDGWTRHEFATSEPLPTYLVAFAVGPFEEVDAGRVEDTPLRIITPQGKASQATYAAEVTAPILELQEAYTGIPYPYAKLDSITIPQTVGFGAMENVGLITYVERLMIAPPEERTVAFERAYARVGAHEIAHQWFGNLVTPEWWDDIWLNESFASWFGSKTMMQWKPEWNAEVDRIDSRRTAISADSLATARRIRQPIVREDDIGAAFDSISYSKGATLLAGFERWLGEEAFQRGIRSYLTRYSHDNATAADFLEVLEEATQPGVAAAFSTFLDQSGVPLLSARLRCDGVSAPVLEVAQQRYLPVGSEGEAARLWHIPVCIRRAGDEERQCTLVQTRTATLPLEGTTACPAWVLLNDEGLGYYLSDYTAEALEDLPFADPHALSEAERLSLFQDVATLFAGGRVPAEPALELTRIAARSGERNLVEAALWLVQSLDPWLVPEELEPAYVRLIQELFGEQARVVGLVPREGESEDVTLLREMLVETVAGPGRDAALRSEARRLAEAWLEDRSAVPAESVAMALSLAAADGDERLFERFLQALHDEPDRRNRSRLLSGLTSFTQPELIERTYRLILDPDLDPREMGRALGAGAVNRDSARMRDAFVRSHYEEIVDRIPEMSAAYLPFMSAGSCDAEMIPDVREFWEPRVEAIRGAPLSLERAVESLRLCSAWRDAQAPGTRAFLEGID